MNVPQNILQIVPQLPNERDAVGAYAETLARKLREKLGRETIFVTGETSLSPNDIILHYVNYGYHSRGVPKKLLSILRDLRARCAGKFITIFHELYAAAAPWRSAFWLGPLQKRIARDIAQLSDHCIVSNEIAHAQLRELAPGAHIAVHPVFSNFGEPQLSRAQIGARDPHRWAIIGGTGTIERGLRSFSAQCHQNSSTHVHIVGGNENNEMRKLIVDLAPTRVEHHPNVSANDASIILRECSFAWFDYFHRPNIPGAVILKSSAFAAACAHAIIPVFPHSVSPIAPDLPKSFKIDNLPRAEHPQIAANFYDWYQRNATADRLTNSIAAMLS